MWRPAAWPVVVSANGGEEVFFRGGVFINVSIRRIPAEASILLAAMQAMALNQQNGAVKYIAAKYLSAWLAAANGYCCRHRRGCKAYSA